MGGASSEEELGRLRGGGGRKWSLAGRIISSGWERQRFYLRGRLWVGGSVVREGSLGLGRLSQDDDALEPSSGG